MTDHTITPATGKVPDLAALFKEAKLNGKAQIKLSIAKEQSTAKTAITPVKKAKAFASKAAKAEAANAKWERPNLFALCRKLVGTDLAAAVLLFHILYLWNNRDHKLNRQGREWLAHTREKWADACGLTLDELAKRALPRLKKNCWEFLTIKAMGRGSDKKVWVSLDTMALREQVSGSAAMPWEMFHAALNGIGPGFEKQPVNAYADPSKK